MNVTSKTRSPRVQTFAKAITPLSTHNLSDARHEAVGSEIQEAEGLFYMYVLRDTREKICSTMGNRGSCSSLCYDVDPSKSVNDTPAVAQALWSKHFSNDEIDEDIFRSKDSLKNATPIKKLVVLSQNSLSASQSQGGYPGVRSMSSDTCGREARSERCVERRSSTMQDREEIQDEVSLDRSD